jgi:hypothetical protein
VTTRAPAPCHHKVKHQHGTQNAYLQDGCRCDPCTDANTAAMRAYRLTRTASMVPAGPARAHIRALLAHGHTWHSIGTAAGLDPLTVQAIIEGVPRRGEYPRQTIRAATAQAILNYQPQEFPIAA